MQPYFLPYIGYFQLLKSVDEFVVYDNIQFSKAGWVQRNRLLQGGKDCLFSLPLKKGSDFLNINQRYLSDNYEVDRDKLLRRINAAYSKAPHYSKVMPLIEQCFLYGSKNLFEFIHNSLMVIIDFLQIETKIVISSTINVDSSLRSQEKVIAICETTGAKEYVNAIGGQNLYDKSEFIKHGVELHFIKTQDYSYQQFGDEFVRDLSILDIMMFNDTERIQQLMNNYTLV